MQQYKLLELAIWQWYVHWCHVLLLFFIFGSNYVFS